MSNAAVKEAYAVMRAAWPAWAAKQDVDSARIWSELVAHVPNLVATVRDLAGKSEFAPSIAEIKQASGMYRCKEPVRERVVETPLTEEELAEVETQLATNVQHMLRNNLIGRDAALVLIECAVKQRRRHNQRVAWEREVDRKRQGGGDNG